MFEPSQAQKNHLYVRVWVTYVTTMLSLSTVQLPTRKLALEDGQVVKKIRTVDPEIFNRPDAY
jgi:hypothetical protein